MQWTIAISFAATAGIFALVILRALDRRADRREWARLEARQPEAPVPFSPAMVADLPDPVRRYFTWSIRPDTPLLPVAVVEMTGRFGLGTRDDPKYQPMHAREILAAPAGFLWQLRTRAGMRISGSDSGHWTRFRILGLFPVVRRGADADHGRAAFGRCVAEALFWTPAALLPGPGVRWDAVDADRARVTVRHGEFEESIEVTLDDDGRPRTVVFLRWSDANPERTYRRQPFGGTFGDFRDVGGYRLPFRVEAGNMFGTDAYFPFFVAEITAIRFPGARS